MERWCLQVLFLVTLAALMWPGAKADDETFENFKNHCCTYFERLDHNGDLKLTLDDFLAMTINILLTDKSLSLIGLILAAEQVTSLAQQALKFFPLTNTNILNVVLGDTITLKEFLTSMISLRYTKQLEYAIRNMTAFIHRTFNADGNDMKLTRREYGDVLKALGIDTSTTDAGFRDMDLDGNGFIEWYECTINAMGYFNNAIFDRTNSWAGPGLTCLEVAKNDTSKLP